MRGRNLIFNTLLLTATSFLMRAVGVSFQVYLSNKIGPAGIGLFQLIMSVNILAFTFATSGIRFSAMRIISEELGVKNYDGVRKSVRCCMAYALLFGLLAGLALYFSSEFVGTKWIGNSASILSLKLLSISMPFLALVSVLSGYFTAVSRVIKPALVQVAEQLVNIGVIVAALRFVPTGNLKLSCGAIILGGLAGDIFSFCLQLILYLFDRRRYVPSGKAAKGIMPRVFSVAIPLALSSYARTFLVTLQNLLIPRGLQKSGASAQAALSDYGKINGMVFPIITFPSALFVSLADLLVPELTAAQVRGDTSLIDTLVNRILTLCIMFAIGIMCFLIHFSRDLGITIYSSGEIGQYIFALSFLLPVMYADTITDGMLKGLGQHIASMRYNIIDSLLSVILLYIFLPIGALKGYIFLLYFSEIFNFSLSIHRLSKTAHLSLDISKIVASVLCGAGAANFSILLLRLSGHPLHSSGASLLAHFFLSSLLFTALLRVLGCITSRDIKWFYNMLRQK